MFSTRDRGGGGEGNMPMKAEGGDEAVVPTHSQPSIRSRWVVSVALPPLYPLKRTDNSPAGG